MNITFHRFLSVLTLTIVFTIAVSLSTAQSATITAEVRDAALNQDSLKLKVFLSKQPGHREALAQKEVFQPEFNRLSNQVQELIQPFVIGRDAIPQAIRARLKNIHREHDTALDDMRRAIYAGIKPQIEPQQSRVVTFITDVLRGEVYAQVGFVNTLGVKIPSTALNQLANHPDVARISKDHEGQLDLDDTAKAIGADHLWNIGYDGDGVWDVAVIDSGVTIDHPGLRSHKDGGAFYSTTGEEYADDDYGHGTAVAGIIASTNSTYKGVAPGIDKIIICKVIDEDGPISETSVSLHDLLT